MTRAKSRQARKADRRDGAPWRRALRRLYEAATPTGRRFRYGLLVFDIVTVLYIVVTSFLPHEPWIGVVDALLGCVVLTDFAARLAIARKPWREMLHPSTWADVAAMKG